MSNELPKIKATCEAGCLWETVHRSEFEKSASIIKIYPNADGEYILEKGKTYKIKSASALDEMYEVYAFLLSLAWQTWSESSGAENGTYTVPEIVYDKYADGVKFRFCDVNADGGMPNFVYEIDGERQTVTLADISTDSMSDYTLTLTNATEVYLYNSDAEIGVGQLPIVTEEDNGKVLRVVNGMWSVDNIPDAEEASF